MKVTSVLGGLLLTALQVSASPMANDLEARDTGPCCIGSQYQSTYEAYVIPAGTGTYSFTAKGGIILNVIRNPGGCQSWQVTTGKVSSFYTPIIMDMQFCRDHA
ncbi:hypothetical protein E4U54_004066 [Claviceps lovelessii]|nr:hypothetical protein E4U54_004066 [Claviceps lovelessii]